MEFTSDTFDYLFKLLLIGDSGVGKSSLLIRFTDNTFNYNIQSTIGVDFKIKTKIIDGVKIKVTIWDTAGQEKFRTLTSSYYRGAQGIILVYDITNRSSFDNISSWIEEINTFCPENTDLIKLLIGNKIDMANRAVDKTEAQNFAQANGLLYAECSAKSSIGIMECFDEMVNAIMNNPTILSSTAVKERNQYSLGKIYDEGPSEPKHCCSS